MSDQALPVQALVGGDQHEALVDEALHNPGWKRLRTSGDPEDRVMYAWFRRWVGAAHGIYQDTANPQSSDPGFASSQTISVSVTLCPPAPPLKTFPASSWPGSASGPDVPPTPSGARLPDENAMKRLKGIEKPVSDSSDASMEQALLLQDARQEMLPSFLQPTAQMWTAESSDFKAMQEMKAREVEHVRWRAARPPGLDPELQRVVQTKKHRV